MVGKMVAKKVEKTVGWRVATMADLSVLSSAVRRVVL